MAVKKIIEIDVDELKAIGGLQNLSKALDKVDESAKDVNATFEQVYGDLQPLTTRMGEAEDRMYELALAGKTTSQEYKDLLASVANYRKTQIETDRVVDASATRLDEKLGGALQGVTSSFAAVQGVMALTGGQSEDLEKAILKVQGAMALAEGVRGIREGANSFKALGVSAKNALAGIRTGIAATGIGALVIALGLVIAYWDDIKAAVNGVSSEQESLNELAQTNLDTEQGKLDAISSQDNVLKLQGKSEKDILKIKIAQTDEVIKATENQITQNDITAKAQIAAAERNKDILRGILDFLTIPFRTVLETVDSIGKAIGQNFGLADNFSKLLDKGSSLIFDPEAERKKAEETRNESLKGLNKLKNDRAGLQLSIKNIDAQASKDAIAKAKETKDKEIELAKERADALERIRQGEIDTESERRAEELKQVQDQYALLIAEAEKYGQDTTQLKEAQRTKEKEIQDKFDLENKEKADKKKKDDEDYWAGEADRAIADAEKKKQDAENEKQLENEVLNAKIGIAQQGLALVQEVAGKGSKIGKAAAIAQTVITGIQGVQNAYSTAQKSPITALFPAYPILQAGIAGAFSALQIAKMKSASATGGGGSSVPSTPSISTGATAPTFNVVGNAGVNQVEQALGNNQPVQAYVVAGNVTTAQALNRNIINNATLG